MPVIADTAYPRLPAEPGPAELEAFTPEAAELAFARRVGHLPAWYSSETDAAVRAAAAEILAGAPALPTAA